MSTVNAAIALSQRGLAVFPCRETKAPACPNGFLAATSDLAAVRDLWRRYPGPLIGVPTGERNAFDVLDLDPRHGSDAWLATNRHRLPPTRCHATRSGGTHMLFRHAVGVRNSASKIGPGVDVRGEGGFIIWWPAAGCQMHNEMPPAAWPDWLLDLLAPPPPPPVTRPVLAAQHVPTSRVAALIATALTRVELAQPGQRHERLRAAARTLGGVLDVGGISAADAERVLLDAVQRAGGAAVHVPNAVGTIRWGLERGRSSPLDLGGPRA